MRNVIQCTIAAGVLLSACGGQSSPAANAADAGAQAPPPPAQTEQRGRTMVDARPLALDAMIQTADRIFVGVVKSVRTSQAVLTEGDQSTTAEVRDVTIEVRDGIKNAKTGENVVVRQLATVSSPVNEGEEILWYLARNSRLGLTQPLGVYSGDFRIQTTATGKVVENLSGNLGLWKDSIWNGDGFARSEVIAEAQLMKLPPARMLLLEKTAASDPELGEIPLDFLIAVTKSAVK
jgi:hypothetical protein